MATGDGGLPATGWVRAAKGLELIGCWGARSSGAGNTGDIELYWRLP